MPCRSGATGSDQQLKSPGRPRGKKKRRNYAAFLFSGHFGCSDHVL
nr:MAG TPA: hypothetical protein [Bacteriophage sp.]